MKYVDTMVVFREIPDEITLAINISGCNIHCKDCHSKYLWKDIGKTLNTKSLNNLITANDGITCVCFMGGNQDLNTLFSLFSYIKTKFNNLKIAWYSGETKFPWYFTSVLNFIKLGPYIKEKGGLNNPNTNQCLYQIKQDKNNKYYLLNITEKLQLNNLL